MIRNRSCTLCPLHDQCFRVCIPGTGRKFSRGFVVGEAPGYQEDQRGMPFVGAAGKFLRSEMTKAGLSPASVYLTNVAKCYPSTSRNPKLEEAEICAQNYLKREIEEYKPSYILALGKISTYTLSGLTDVNQYQGQLCECRFSDALVIPCWHPAYILRQPRKKPEFVDALNVFCSLITLGL